MDRKISEEDKEAFLSQHNSQKLALRIRLNQSKG